MIERTLIPRSTRAIVVASVVLTPYAAVSTPTTPSSTIPRPAGLNGTAVSNEPISATKKAPEIPSSTSG